MTEPFPTRASSRTSLDSQSPGTAISTRIEQQTNEPVPFKRTQLHPPSREDNKYHRRFIEAHNDEFIEFRAPPYSSNPENEEGNSIHDESSATRVRYSTAFSRSFPTLGNGIANEIIPFTIAELPPITFPQPAPYRMVDLQRLRDTMPGTMSEYIRLRESFPGTSRALLGLSPEIISQDEFRDAPLRHLVLKHQCPGPFKLGQQFYAHGSINGVWELGEVKKENGKKLYVQWVNHFEKCLAIVEMDRSSIHQTKRRRTKTLLQAAIRRVFG
ncbi:hypothetical protein C8F04DRAFT_1172749 [Mycena alexandri]|uniref:Uncharacterized protein n=1 Tax=Mycena alexandri TaxID=1745969 RepID=A0AAD6TKF5_9AGAR|nr:hypothetical protein C8F04DRAFT_1172749 [Mycena alexandri]